MARKPRVEYPGALYHVMCRGNNGEYVLNKDEDKLIYLELVRKYKERYGFKLYSYCIMNNHVHLLIEMETVELSKIMQGIQQSFTQRYNKKYNRTGHVFQQRYKAVLCDKDNYLLQLIKYIHYNPVEAGIEAGLNYQWSSHNNYLKFKNDGLVEIDFVLGMFREDYKKAHRLYEEFMNLNNGDNDIDDYTIKYESSVAMGEDIDKSSTMDIDEIIDLICLRAGVKREEM
ncbi:MAG: transposase [Lutispora sp.]|nr:transposase [Lutispora sp.]